MTFLQKEATHLIGFPLIDLFLPTLTSQTTNWWNRLHWQWHSLRISLPKGRPGEIISWKWLEKEKSVLQLSFKHVDKISCYVFFPFHFLIKTLLLCM